MLNMRLTQLQNKGKIFMKATSFKNKFILILFFFCAFSSTTQATLKTTFIAVGPYQDHSIIVVSKDNGKTWLAEQLTTLPYFSSISRVSCSGSNNDVTCGLSKSNSLAMNSDNLKTWLEVKMPPYFDFSDFSCSGNGISTICAAVGASVTDTIPGGANPVLTLSTDGGTNWSWQLPTNGSGRFTHVSCSGADSNKFCVATGDVEDKYLIYAITHNGKWDYTEGYSGEPWGVSCIGEREDATCAIVGKAHDETPYIAMLNVDKNNLDKKQISNYQSNGYLNAISCTGHGVTGICTAGGKTGFLGQPGRPLLVVSTSGGDTWWVKPLSDLPLIGTFYTTNCAGAGNKAVCVAAGSKKIDDEEIPIIAVSRDGGENWAFENVEDASYGSFLTTKCIEMGNKVICAAAGYGKNKEDGLLAVSINNGKDWQVKEIKNLPANSGRFNSLTAYETND